MNEKQKLLWILGSVHATLTTRMRVTPELIRSLESTMDRIQDELNPDGVIPPPGIQLQVTDFKLPKDLLERVA